MCYFYWTKRKVYFTFMIVSHLNVLIIWILVTQFLDTWLKFNCMSWVYGYVYREQQREKMRQKMILYSCKDKTDLRRFVLLVIFNPYKLELRLSNKKMRKPSLIITCEKFLWSDYQTLHKDCVAKGKKESSSAKQQSSAVRIRPHYFPAIFCPFHYAVHKLCVVPCATHKWSRDPEELLKTEHWFIIKRYLSFEHF